MLAPGYAAGDELCHPVRQNPTVLHPALTQEQLWHSNHKHVCDSTMHSSGQGDDRLPDYAAQSTDHVQTAPRGSEREELLNLQIRLESKIRASA